MTLTFEWDEAKAIVNFKKHKVSFDEGKTIFNDPFLFTFPDNEHSIGEERYINIGISVKGRILILTNTERKDRIRIINCRKATASERRFYEEGSSK
ncbi:MAG: BrnT family toxin [bacterium]|nr:BrnT family toxin [bacterium]